MVQDLDIHTANSFANLYLTAFVVVAYCLLDMLYKLGYLVFMYCSQFFL